MLLRGNKRKNILSLTRLLWLPLGPPPGPIDVNDGQGVGSAVGVEDDIGFVVVLAQVELEAVTVLGGVLALSTPVHVSGDVGLHVRVQHRLVDARVVAMWTLERLRPKVVPHMVLQMMLHKITKIE